MFNKFQVAFVILAFFIFSVSAQEFPQYESKYVNDFAGVLDDSQKQEIITLFTSIEGETTAEMVFVSMSTIGNEDISKYATDLGQSWGVGKKSKDSGLVILYVKDIGKLYVAVGYGIEGILPDSKVGRILDETYVPARDSGNVSQGIVLASKALSQVILENKEEVLSGKASSNNTKVMIYVIIGVIIFIVILSFLSPKNKYRVLSTRRTTGGFKIGGMSGGGFGGGRFGGGGAGR